MREFLKTLARGIATVLVLPELVIFRMKSWILGRDRALEGSSQVLSLVPGLFGIYLRRAFLQCVLAKCHRTVVVEFGTLFSQTGAELNENVYIGPRCHLGLVTVGSNTLIGPAVHIPSGARTHGTDDPEAPIRDQPHQRQRVCIGPDAWIGSAAIVMADVGAGAVIGAGAVVTRPIPNYAVAVGVPARVIRSRR